MILLYILFALTISVVLTALFAPRVPEQRRGDVFIAFFIVLLVAGAVVGWEVPAIAAGKGAVWTLLVVFAALLAVSTLLSVRPRSFVRAGGSHNLRQDAEAAAFDIMLWLLMLIFGILVMRRLGM